MIPFVLCFIALSPVKSVPGCGLKSCPPAETAGSEIRPYQSPFSQAPDLSRNPQRFFLGNSCRGQVLLSRRRQGIPELQMNECLAADTGDGVESARYRVNNF